MRILQCHNFYTLRAGECRSVEMQIRLLRDAGHEVELFSCDNAEIPPGHRWGTIKAGVHAVHSRRTVRDISAALQKAHFDVVHVHNTWPLMSPSVFRAASRQGVPVVATIHNFRWLCPAATLYRDGRVCHDCLERPGGTLHAVVHRCYRGSVLASAAAALSLTVNRDLLRVFDRHIDVIVVQNPFVGNLLGANGFPTERFTVIPNALPRGTIRPTSAGDFILFAGRLEECKGVRTLLAAARMGGFPLHIFGHGPLASLLERSTEYPVAAGDRISYGGLVDHETVIDQIAASAAVVVPSEWYESCPNVIVEALAHGKPVVASRIGGLPGIVKDGENGLLFEPGNADALAACVGRLLDDGALRARLEAGARAAYAGSFSPESLVDRLVDAYRVAMSRRARTGMIVRNRGRQGNQRDVQRRDR